MTFAAEVAVDVLVLLRRGRVAPALAQLERLPALIRDDLLEAGAAGYEAGVAEGRRSLAAEITGDAKPKRPAKVAGRESGFGIAGPPDVGSSPPVAQRKRPRRLAWLARRVRDQRLRRLVLDVLRFCDAGLDRVLAGTVQLSSSQRRRLRAGLGQ